MSNSIDLLTLKTSIDDTSVTEFEKSLEKALEGALKDVDTFNKSAQVTLNFAKLQQNIKDITAEIAKLTARKHEVELRIKQKGESKALTKELKTIDAELTRLGKAREVAVKVNTSEIEKARKAVSQFGNALDMVKGIAAGFAGGFAAIKFADMARDAVIASERYDMLGIAMENVGKNAGYSRIEMDVYVETLRKGGIAMEEARQLITQMSSANIDLSNSMQLARTAQDSAVIAGLNSTETFERLINGLVQGDTLILRNIGLITNFEQAYKDFADSIGKPVAALTEQEKMQARVNEVLKAGEKNLGTYEASLNSTYKKMTSLPRYFSEIQTMAGKLGGGVFDDVINKVDSLTKSTHGWLQELKDTGELEETGRKIGDALGTVGEVALSAGAGMALYKSGILDVATAAPKAIKSINAKTTATVAEAKALRDAAEAEYHRAYAASMNNTEALKSMELARALAKATDGVALAQKNVDIAQKNATVSAKALALAQTGLEKSMAGVKRVIALLGGPANIAIMAATYGVYKLMTAQSDGEAMASKYGTTIDDVRKYFDEYALASKGAEESTTQMSEALLRNLEAQKQGLAMSIDETMKEITRLTGWVSETVIINGQDVDIKFNFKTEEARRAEQEINQVIANLDDTKESALDAGVAIQGIVRELENLAKSKGSGKLASEYQKVQEQADKFLLHLKKLAKERAQQLEIEENQAKNAEETRKANDETIKQEAEIADIQDNIGKAYEKTQKARIEGLNTEIEQLDLYIARLKEVVATGALAEDAASSLIDKAIAARKEKEKELDSLLNPKSSRSSGGYAARKEDAMADLKAEYEARQELARRTVTDEQELRRELLEISRDYYERYEQLLEDSYVAELRKNKDVEDATRHLSDAQIAELLRVQDMRKQLSVDDSSLAQLEEEYRLQTAVAQQTIEDAKQLEAVMLAIKQNYLEQKRDILQMLAEAEVATFGSVREETRNAIQATVADIDKVKEASKEAATVISKEFSDAFNDISQHIVTMSTQLGAFFDNYYDARIESLDASHERELRMIDNRLEAEMAMYEEQLKQYEDLEERREEAKTEHEEKLAELNEKIQDHMTEEAYRAIQEQITDEEEKYNEKVAMLDADALYRDELLIAQETAEAEALARKEQLEKEYANRRAQMERKQAVADKASSMFSASINIAQGVTKAWAQGGGLFGHILAALVAAAGAIQMAAIAARPLPDIPSFFKGGVVGEANKHNFPNIPQPNNPYDKTLIWAQKGERILSIAENQRYQSILDSIEAERYNKVQAQHLRQDTYGYLTQSADHSVHNNTPTLNMTIHPTKEYSKRDIQKMMRKGMMKALRG